VPILSNLPEDSAWIDPDDVRRPVVTFGAAMSEVGSVELDFHRHMKGQVLLVHRGALSCEVEGGCGWCRHAAPSGYPAGRSMPSR
jgi:hypothetical protein